MGNSTSSAADRVDDGESIPTKPSPQEDSNHPSELAHNSSNSCSVANLTESLGALSPPSAKKMVPSSPRAHCEKATTQTAVQTPGGTRCTKRAKLTLCVEDSDDERCSEDMKESAISTNEGPLQRAAHTAEASQAHPPLCYKSVTTSDDMDNRLEVEDSSRMIGDGTLQSINPSARALTAPSSRLFASQADNLSINERDAQYENLDRVNDNAASRNEVVNSDESTSKATNTPAYQIRAYPFGTFCEVCYGRLGRDKVASDTTLKRHFQSNPSCLNGDIPDCLNLERQLQRDSCAITRQIGNKSYSDNVVNAFFGQQRRKPKKGHACSNCGKVGKLNELQKHFASEKNSCSETNLVKSDTLLVSQKYKTSGGSPFLFPQSCLMKMTSGEYTPEPMSDSHHKRIANRQQLVQQSLQSVVPPSVVRRNTAAPLSIPEQPTGGPNDISRTHAGVTLNTQNRHSNSLQVGRSTVSVVNDASMSTTPHSSCLRSPALLGHAENLQLLSSPRELRRITDPSYQPINFDFESNAKTQLKQAFDKEEDYNRALGYMPMFLPIISRYNGTLRDNIISLAVSLKDDKSYDLCTELLLMTSKAYLERGVANMHVRLLNAGPRGKIYRSGIACAGIVGEQPCTFTCSKEIKSVLEEIQHLLLFSVRRNYPKWIQYKDQIEYVFHNVPANVYQTSAGNDIQLQKEHAVKLLLDAKGFYGLLVSMVTQRCDKSNGSTLLGDYLVI